MADYAVLMQDQTTLVFYLFILNIVVAVSVITVGRMYEAHYFGGRSVVERMRCSALQRL
jgi:hypothetical protein